MGRCFRWLKRSVWPGQSGHKEEGWGGNRAHIPEDHRGCGEGLAFTQHEMGPLSGWSAEGGRMWLFSQSLWLLFTADARGPGEQ